MFKPKTSKEKVLHRFKITRGHLDKIIRMVESDQYCIDILHQSLAVQKALKQTDHVILENHLKTCATKDIKNGRNLEVVGEIMNVFKRVNP